MEAAVLILFVVGTYLFAFGFLFSNRVTAIWGGGLVAIGLLLTTFFSTPTGGTQALIDLCRNNGGVPVMNGTTIEGCLSAVDTILLE